MLKWLWLSGLVVVLDQISKIVAVALLSLYEPVALLPGVNLTLMYNTGAAFSFLSSAAGWQRWLFILLALVVSGIIVNWLRKLEREERWQAMGLALILGGAIGNVIDRIRLGQVVDFVDVYYRAEQCLPLFVPVRAAVNECHWPAFNVADAAISVGVVVLILDGIRQARRKPARPDDRIEPGESL
jgi:signal peptidase II